MNILFYVLPVVERQEPRHKTSWVEKVGAYADLLSKSGAGRYRFACAVGDTLYDYARSKIKNCEIIRIPHSAIIPALAKNALEYTIKVHQAGDAVFLHRVAEAHAKFLGREKYDLCISFTSVPFMKELYPDIAVLHTETAVFRKPPFPHTVYLDPAGMYDQASLPRMENLAAYAPSAAEEKLLAAIQDHHMPAARPDSGQQAILGAITKGFRKTVLLALDLPNHYPFNSCSAFDDPYDLVLNALESLPENFLLIVAPHPKLSTLSGDAIAYFSGKYKNFYWGERIARKISSYTFLFNADVVATVTSTVGLHAVLWEKPLIVLGKSQLNGYAQSFSFAEAEAAAALRLPASRRKSLAWVLTRYAIPVDLLYQADILERCINRAVQCRSGQKNDLAAYYAEPFYDVDGLTDFYLQDLVRYRKKTLLKKLNVVKTAKDFIRYKLK